MMSTTVPIHSGFMAGSATRAADVTRACTRLAWLATSSTARYLVWLAGDVVRSVYQSPLVRSGPAV